MNNKYYAHINLLDNSMGRGQCPCSGEGIVCIEISEDMFYNIDRYIYKDGEIVLDPDYEKKKELERQDKINHLTMTALDFINVIKSLGVSNEMIEGFLATNFEVKHQLMFCQNVYCGVAKSFLPIRIGTTEITPEMIEKAFIDKNGGEI